MNIFKRCHKVLESIDGVTAMVVWTVAILAKWLAG